ncbi:MAG: carbohydrate binding domain-containing protein [Candidatus Omnitrophica bacterium]|nr:carbohydrate binding domain-containing protein [Candidatus Omnitrophota bacterium]
MKNLKVIPAILVILIFAVAYAFLKNSQPAILAIDDFEGEISPRTVDFGSGAGSELKVTPSTDIKHSGKQALKLEYKSVINGYMWAARGYGLDVKGAAKWLKKPQEINWPKYKALVLYMYGQNSGAMLALDVIDADFEYFRFMIKDNFSGWKEIICPFDGFFARGDWQPDKAKTNAKLDFPVKAFQFEPRSIGQGTFYLDYVHLIKKE